ncbi:MAG: M28 family peptidase [Saprospiraceae bacterium]|nr:M28 family peptidase [Saprospiraceae bacterium]
MKRPLLLAAMLFMGMIIGHGQAENTRFTNPEVLPILQGDYDPADYRASVIIDDPGVIFQKLVDEINPDSLKSYLEALSTFENRNTGSDTLSDQRGIGAAQRWCYRKFESFSQNREDRLESTYLVFDQNICGMGRHKNVISVLPGQGAQKEEVIVVLAHLDSRCADRCGTDCLAQGMEDNGSGSALVLELARVMSQFTFNRTVVFMLTTGEEQGLHGARAFADYCTEQNVNVYAAYNNDIVGGVICGETASPPGCPYLNHIDSVNVRVYSAGGTRSKFKMLARFIEREYNTHLAPIMDFAHVVNIMTPEDRTGRGGDHIPFRENRFATVRFSSANEHGDGNPSQPGYHDRQHTREDVLGVDTDGDNVIDSFFVHFNYLSRNAMINAGAITSSALGPIPVADFQVEEQIGGFSISIDDPNNYGKYLVGVKRLGQNVFDTTYIIETTVDTLPVKSPFWYYINVATLDSNNVQSHFCLERDVRIQTTGTEDLLIQSGVQLLQNYPNPFDDATTIAVVVNEYIKYNDAEIRIFDESGVQLAVLPITLDKGSNEVIYSYRNHEYKPGVYRYGLWVDGKRIDMKSMVYAY